MLPCLRSVLPSSASSLSGRLCVSSKVRGTYSALVEAVHAVSLERIPGIQWRNTRHAVEGLAKSSLAAAPFFHPYFDIEVPTLQEQSVFDELGKAGSYLSKQLQTLSAWY